MTSFGPFRFDTANQRLYSGSDKKQLTNKAAAILKVLTNRPNEIVAHDQLLDSVWPGVHVQPEVLKVYIAEIRRALGDSAGNPRYIETVHGRGYRLIALGHDSRALDTKRSRSEQLVGRTHEIAHLCAVMRRAAAGRRQMVFITGEAGIGKTSLLKDFIHRAERQPGVRTALGQVAHVRGETEPFSPLLGVVGELLTGHDREAFTAAFRQTAPGWLLQLPSLVDAAEIDQARRQLTGATSQRMIREFAEAMSRCCRDRLMVVELDDIHRADSSTLDLLDYIACRDEPAKLLVIAAADAAEGPPRVRSLIAALNARQLCEEMRLEPLSRDSVQRFLDRRYPGSNAGAVLAERLHHLSGGIPLFLRSAVNYIQAQGWILKTDRGWILSTDAVRLEELVPHAVKDLVDLELRQLPALDQQVLEAASIVGQEFLPAVVADALETPLSVIEETCDRILQRGGWIRSAGFEPLPDGGVSVKFQFLHWLYREVLYCRQSPVQRVRRHRRVALVLETAFRNGAQASASELALHFAAGRRCSKSAEYLRVAAATASRRFAGSEAAALLTEALKDVRCLSPAARHRTELEMLDELGAAYFASGDLDNCARAWRQAASRALEYGHVDIALHALSRLAFPVGWEDPARLRASADRLIVHVHKIADPVLRAEVTMRLLALRDIGGAWTVKDSQTAGEAFNELLRDGNHVRIASAQVQEAWFQLRSSAYEYGIAALEESLPVVLQHDALDVIRAEWALSWALLHAGEWGRMQAVATAASAHAQKNGSRRIEALFNLQLAWLHVECGAYESAQNLCRQAIELSGNRTRGIGVVMCQVIMAMAAVGRGEAVQALECVRCALNADSRGESFWRALARTAALEAHVMTHSIPEIRATAHRLLRFSENLREQTWKAVALSACARAAAATGQQQLAQRCSEAALDLVNNASLPLAKWRVEAAAAEIIEKLQTDANADSQAQRLRKLSRQSREKLFSSLPIQDPLRSFARAPVRSRRQSA